MSMSQEDLPFLTQEEKAPQTPQSTSNPGPPVPDIAPPLFSTEQLEKWKPVPLTQLVIDFLTVLTQRFVPVATVSNGVAA